MNIHTLNDTKRNKNTNKQEKEKKKPEKKPGFDFSSLNPFKDNNNNNKSKSNTTNAVNPIQALINKQKKFSGAGNSLGGRRAPGGFVRVSLPTSGSLGVMVEKTATGGTIVANVEPNSQGAQLGLQRGDVLCFAESNGEELVFDHFLLLVREDPRPPFEIDVLRIKVAGANKHKQNTETGGRSAQDDIRRQAVLAAAAAREQKSNTLQKGIVRKTANNRNTTINSSQHSRESKPLSEESKAAVAAAKASEAKIAEQMGYNPYEVVKSGANTARVADLATSTSAPKSNPFIGSEPSTSPPLKASIKPKSVGNIRIDESFDQSLGHLLSSNNTEDSTKAISTMRKLIVNATTKEDIKFRKVKLSNARIQREIVNVPGAVDLMLAVGFVLAEDEETKKSILIYSGENIAVPDWLPAALNRMDEVIS